MKQTIIGWMIVENQYKKDDSQNDDYKNNYN